MPMTDEQRAWLEKLQKGLSVTSQPGMAMPVGSDESRHMVQVAEKVWNDAGAGLDAVSKIGHNAVDFVVDTAKDHPVLAATAAVVAGPAIAVAGTIGVAALGVAAMATPVVLAAGTIGGEIAEGAAKAADAVYRAVDQAFPSENGAPSAAAAVAAPVAGAAEAVASAAQTAVSSVGDAVSSFFGGGEE